MPTSVTAQSRRARCPHLDKALHRFAHGIGRDHAAVLNGLTPRYQSGGRHQARPAAAADPHFSPVTYEQQQRLHHRGEEVASAT